MYTRKLRKNKELREVKLEKNINSNSDGSVFINIGNTLVLCNATIEYKVPSFLQGKKLGWITAEYGMLPCSCSSRVKREAKQGVQTPRTQEIQRFIGRSLRSAVDLSLMPEIQIVIDCDVLNADGGTRVASICGGYCALVIALNKLKTQKLIELIPVKEYVAAISCGIVGDELLLDLDYIEDSQAILDANFVFTESFKVVEIQCCAEAEPVDFNMIANLVDIAKIGIEQIISAQKKILQGIL